MDHLQTLTSQVRRLLLAGLLLEAIVLGVGWWLLVYYLRLDPILAAPVVALIGLLVSIVLAWRGARLLLQPTTALWQTILHVAPGFHGVAPPKIDSLRVGRELVTALSAQIQNLVMQAEHLDEHAASSHKPQADAVLRGLSLPLIALNKNRAVIFLNEPAAQYIGLKTDEIIGKNFYSVFNLFFSGETTLDSWLNRVSSSKALSDASWDRVRLKVGDGFRQFDMAAHYSRDNPMGAEVTLALFDHTATYTEDDDGVGFVALCVHELRTPLTLLRGYIEVFEDELEGKLTPELDDFMQKMHASAQQLTAFVSNILNVTRVDNDQLTLSLQEEDWGTVLRNAVDNLKLRAQVRGLDISCEVAEGLPTVGVDSVSIFEVLSNLVDNAIKYSGDSKQIAIHCQLTQDGFVETTVQDWGVGIPESVIPNLFTKFYRNFHNRAQIGGTGLGLYLCKAVVSAHGGNIWVRSHEEQGTTFGFTVIPYSKLADDQKNGDNKEIVRGAHGWIKNHSLYRR